MVEYPAAPDSAWLAKHRWKWHPARLDERIARAQPRTLFVCGGADNQLAPAGRFSRTLLLELGVSAMVEQLDAPSRDGTFGRIGDRATI